MALPFPPLTLRYITFPVNSRLYYRRLSSPSPSPALDSRSDGSPSSSSSTRAPRRFPKFPRPRRGDADADSDGAVERHHPAFRPMGPRQFRPDAGDAIRLTEKGVTYNLKDAPFEFQYSYTETPKVKPVALREPPFLPFGPGETPRPWTGRAPLPPSKKKLPEFDSFKLPPPGKKGVKPVQKPGPFLAGSGGPRYSMSREEILGDPLTKEEVEELIKGCLKTRRQLNMGRDGFTHNMLENIHSHWKRRRVCKIRCLGVCTVDLDNVCQQLEDKTGGKVIHRQGGVIYLFRGRNYNYKTRPRYPLMLWRPISPVYPRLVKRVPDGLTLEEAKLLRKKGREVPPICKLGKNGVYVNLVNQVREAFEVCELVRVNCKGMNKSDYKKIGAKLQDLVPCVLLSFEFEHILMWRGREWKSSLIESNGMERPAELAKVAETFSGQQILTTNMCMESSTESAEDAQSFSELKPDTCSDAISSIADKAINANIPINNADISTDDAQSFSAVGAGKESPSAKTEEEQNTEESKCPETKMEHLEGMRHLLEQAIDNNIATSLSELEYPDADIVYQRSVEFAKTALSGPIFQVRNNRKKETTESNSERHEMLESFEDEERENSQNTSVPVISGKKVGDINIKKSGGDRWKLKKDRLLEVIPNVVPHGSLRVDELAKLLS